ncbi:MAG: redoxin domain-containing protein [Flammeovirgaceae bacterium]
MFGTNHLVTTLAMSLILFFTGIKQPTPTPERLGDAGFAYCGADTNEGTQNRQTSQQYDIIGVRATGVHGDIYRIGVENKQAFPVVIVFMEVGCVISQRMIPHLNELAQDAEKQGVKFYGVLSSSLATWEEGRQFQKEYAIQFPLLFDATGDLAHRLKPSVYPESFVFDLNDRLLYYGRINDQYSAVGKFNKQIRQADLQNAIRSAAKREIPLVRHQKAIGCIFEPWKTDRTLTFTKDIEPIIRANCASCHKPNDIGPFPLLNYQDVARRGRMVEYVTKKGYMPIWKAEKGYGKFSNEHRLSDYQINLIKQWVNSGMKEGEAKHAMPALKLPKNEWKLGQPDLILKMEPYDLPASGEDQYRVFVMKDAIPKGKVIKAIDFKPGDASVVHHSTIFIDYSKKLRAYDESDPKAGYDAFEKGGTMEFGSAISVCGWAPGIGPYLYPDDVGFYVEDDADIAFENHYHLSGKATTDQSYVGIYFADEAPSKYITGSIMGTQRLQVPANESEFTKSVWTYVPADIDLLDLTPHMHYIGKSVKIDLILPNGQKDPLLHVNDWDLRWQSVYTLREMKRIPKGSIITAEFVYDNSEDNHDNPHYPAQEMFWGWASNDEMCEVYFSYVPADTGDYGKMLKASLATFEHDYPLEDRVDVNEGNLEEMARKFAQVDVYSSAGRTFVTSIVEADLANKMLNKLNSLSSSIKNETNFKVNKGVLSLTDAYLSFNERQMIRVGEKFAATLYQIRMKEPANWNVAFAYAKLLIGSGSPTDMRDGVAVLKQLVTEQERGMKQDKYALAYWELGKYYYTHHQDQQAEQILKQGLEFHPNHPDLKQELASKGRIVKKKLK